MTLANKDLLESFDTSLLPAPPSDAERAYYADPASLGLAVSLIALAIAFGTGSYLFVLNKPFWVWPYAVFSVIVFFGLLSSGYLYSIAKRVDMYWWEQKKKWTYRDADRIPWVDVFLPSCGENIELLAHNFYHVSRIRYPNFRVWALDDAGRPEVEALARRYRFEYLARPGSEFKKSGNMRYAFARSEGELILVLDADFAPHPAILADLVWPFLDDPTIGLVQSPHYFRSNKKQDNPLKAGGDQLQSPFFRIVQNARDKVGRGGAICCGSNALYKRKALEPSGGSAMVPRSEDVATGLLIIAQGYRIKYVPLCLATGLNPSTLRSYISMVSRWAGGCFSIRFSKYLWNERIPFSVKVSYMGSALSFFIIGTGVIGYAVPGLVNLLFYPESLKWANYQFIIPAIALLAFIRARWAVEPWGPSVFYASFVFSYTSLVAIVDFIRGANVPWVATGQKYSKGSSYSRVMWIIRWIPQIGLGLCLAGIYKNWNAIADYAWVPTTLFWSLKFWGSRLILRQADAEDQTDLVLRAVEEMRREVEIKQYLSLPASTVHQED